MSLHTLTGLRRRRMGSAAAGPCCQRPFRAFTDVIFLGRATAGLKLGTIGLRSLRQHDRGPQTAWSYNTPSHRTPRPHATHRGYQFQFLSRISPVNPRDPGAVAPTIPHPRITRKPKGFLHRHASAYVASCRSRHNLNAQCHQGLSASRYPGWRTRRGRALPSNTANRDPN